MNDESDLTLEELWKSQFAGLEQVRLLKQEKSWESARALTMAMVERAEVIARREGGLPAPGYTLEAAVVLRKLGDIPSEVAVLERYLRWTDGATQEKLSPIVVSLKKIQDRLARARNLTLRNQ